MAKRAPPAAGIAKEAARWVARMNSDQRTLGDEGALAAWAEADPQRRAAYAGQTALWDAIGDLAGDPEARALLRRDDIPDTQIPLRRKASRRFALAGAALAAAAAGLAIWFGPQMLGRHVYETARGEQRVVKIADGTILTLDTETRVRVRLSGDERRLFLDSGQARFEVAKDAARPFRVFVNGDEVRAIGTAFDVRASAGGAQVTLEQGVVALYRDTAPKDWAQKVGLSAPGEAKPAAILRPGQQASFEPEGAVSVRQVDLERAQAWRFGRMIFEATPLRDAVAEVNRYGGRRIVLADPALESIPISGVFHVGQPEAFVEIVSATFPIKLSFETDRELYLAAAKPAARAGGGR